MAKVERGFLYFGGEPGAVVYVKPLNGKTFEYEELRKAVGGLVQEMIPVVRFTTVWVNEEGTLLRLPPNKHTWAIAKHEIYALNGYPPSWRISGNALATRRYDLALLDPSTEAKAVHIAQAIAENK